MPVENYDEIRDKYLRFQVDVRRTLRNVREDLENARLALHQRNNNAVSAALEVGMERLRRLETRV